LSYSLILLEIIFRWLTENGDVRLDRVEMIMVELGRVEDEIFRVRRTDELAFQEEQKRRRQSEPVKITDKRLRPAGRKRSLTLDDGDEPKAKVCFWKLTD
jgi:5'-3' exoribonuclease 2